MADVAGRILDRAGAAYNVRHPDFAADATGASDATVAIQAALDAAAADGGGMVVVPTGTYRIGYWRTDEVVPLAVPSNVHLWIQHGATLLANPAIAQSTTYPHGWASRGVVETTYTEGVKITHDGVIDGQKALNPNGRIIGIFVKAARRVRISGSGVIRNMPADPSFTENPGGLAGDGIVIYCNYPLTSNNVMSEDVVITGITVDGADRSGISPLGCRRVRIEGCTLMNTANSNPGSGVDIEPDPGVFADDIIVRGCVFYNNHFGIHTSAHCDGVVIEGNTFRANRHISIATRGKGVTVANNVITAYRNQAIMVFGHVPKIAKDAKPRGAVVTGNVIEGDPLEAGARAGLFLQDVSGVVVQGNRFSNTHDSAIVIAQRGVDGARLTSHSINIAHNHFENCVSSSRSFTGVIAVRSDQTADPATSALRQVFDLHIQGNTFLDTRAAPASADYPITFTNVSDAEKLTHKIFDNTATGMPLPLSGGTEFSQRLSRVVSINPGVIQPGAHLDVDITMNGVAVGDTLIATPQGDVPTAYLPMWNAWPVAANTVRLRIHNNTGDEIDPAAANWRFTALKH